MDSSRAMDLSVGRQHGFKQPLLLRSACEKQVPSVTIGRWVSRYVRSVTPKYLAYTLMSETLYFSHICFIFSS